MNNISLEGENMFRGGRLFLILLAATPLIELVAGSTIYVTYITVLYKIFVLVIGVLVVPWSSIFLRSISRNLLLPTLYVVIFLGTSWFGANFEYSVKYRVLFLPLLLVDFCSWYIAGYFFQERIYAKYIYKLAAVFAVCSLVFAAIGVIDPEQTRVIYGPDVPLAIVPAVMSSSIFFSGILMIAALSSLKKTVVLCAVAALSFPLALKAVFRTTDWGQRKNKVLIVCGSVLLLILVSIPLVPTFIPFMAATIERLSQEREDIIRLAMAAEYLRLLGENFPIGTGYYTFGYLTAETLPYTTYTATGEVLNDGMSLHNTFMHVSLEGGLLALVVIGILYWKLAAQVRRLFSQRPSRGAAIIITVWVLVGIIYGLFNQFHATRYFFGIFGFAFGCYERYIRRGMRL